MQRHALRLGLAVIGIALLAIAAGGSSAAEPRVVKRVPAPASIARAELATDQVIVRFKAGTTAAERRDALSEQSATVDETLLLARTQVVDLPEDTGVNEAIADFEANPDVAYAEPNYQRQALAPPNDPDYPDLWAMEKISAPAAWDLHTGSSSVIVAVIDTGVAYDHPDLAPNIWTNDDAAGGGDNDGNGFVDDTHGWDFVQEDAAPLDFHFHGTHVAGTIGAKGNNALGTTGVNWDVSLMPIRAGDFYGSFSTADTVAAYTYACQNGARVVNGSFGGPGASQAELDAINSPACANTVFVFAAGNDGADNDVTPIYPCSYGSPRIICVAASDQVDERPAFSNYGATSVDLAAPGFDIHSTFPGWTIAGQTLSFEDPGGWSSGTSTAPPSPVPPLWDRTDLVSSAAGWSFTDSKGAGVDYANNAISEVAQVLPLTDLTGKRGCYLQFDLRHEIVAGDFLRIVGGTTNVPAAMNTEIVSLWSNVPSEEFQLVQDDLSMFDGAASVYLKLQLDSNNDTLTGDGAYLDLLSAVCLDPAGEYSQLNGTSMAAPHVSGVAALMFARNPALTVAQLRSIILGTVDPVPGFSNPVPIVATGGRLNARAAVEAAVLPPAPTINLGPSGSVSDTSATFAFTGDPGAVECRLDEAPFAQCLSPVEYTGLAEGEHTFRVRATSVAGPSPTTTRTWIVDTIDPVPATIDSGPPNFVSSTNATFTFSNVESGLTFECSLDGGAFEACTSPKTYSDLAETAHTIDVRAKDAAGNLSGTTSRGWTVSLVDTPTIDSAPPSFFSSTDATFTFTDTEGGTTLECRLDGVPFALCSSPKSYTSLGQGAHTFEVHAVNGVGSVSDPAVHTWTVDTIDPAAPVIDSGPSGLVASTSAVFTFSNVESGLDFECKLDAEPFAPCASPVDRSPVSQGAHTFQIQAKDAAGNTSVVASRSWTADTIAPATPTIDTGPSGTFASTSATFEFTGSEIVECRLDTAPFDLCTSPASYTSLAQGAHTFEVRAQDAAGNASATASRTWTVDTVAPPVPTIDSGPTGFVSSTNASFAISDSEAGAILECRLDTAPFATCTSPVGYTSLGQGEHTFDLRAKDAVDNTSIVVSRTWTVDTIAPPIPTIDSGPSGPVASDSATFTFSDTEGSAILECRLDTAAFALCTSPVSYPPTLAQGAHTFEVQATDAAGNTSSASRAWSVDTVAPPVPTIDSGPSGTVPTRDAEFVFTDAEVGATLECKLDSASFDICTSPVSFTNLDYGSHTFQVRAKDALANTSAAVSRTWTVTPPVPTFDSGPSGTMIAMAAEFMFTGAAGVTLECRLDTASFATCTSPVSFADLTQGAHTFEVRSTKDGVPSLPASRTWTVTTAAPTIGTGPAGSVSSTTADFAFSHIASGLTFECRVDTASFAPCTSPAQFPGLAEGAHTFEVQAKDAAGNTSPAASRGWTVDTTAPPIPSFGTGPTGTVKTTAATFTFSSTEGGVTFECSLDGAAFVACPSPRSLTGLAQGAHSFQVRAKDTAGNPSAAASRAWSVDTIRPNTTIKTGPAKSTKTTTAKLTFTSTETGSTFKCKLDKGAWATCKSPKTYKKLKKGAHTFQVAATDKAGNLDTTPAKKTWKVK